MVSKDTIYLQWSFDKRHFLCRVQLNRLNYILTARWIINCTFNQNDSRFGFKARFQGIEAFNNNDQNQNTLISHRNAVTFKTR